MKLVAVLGSVTPPGRLSRAVEGCLERADSAGHLVELIDLANYMVEYADARSLADRGDDSALLVDKLFAAEAVIFASPVYRASMTGALKNLLDLVPVDALMGKPCGIVAMGATLHHYLGVDSHLRDVLAWFGAVAAPTSVYLSNADFAEGVLTEGPAGQLDRLVEGLAQLASMSISSPTPLAAMSAPRAKVSSG
jgi:FMN reductase